MNMAKGRRVDGFLVHCDVIQINPGLFKLEVTTQVKDSGVTERVWQMPRARVFFCQDEAEREARFILRSIRDVDEWGEPALLAA